MHENQIITLYDYPRSSAAYRVRIALALLNLPYQSVKIDLLSGAQNSSEHRARNPQGLVPALAIDGQIVTQSLAILEYLNETRNAGFLPTSPPQRAAVRAMAMAIAIEIHPICNLRVARHAVAASGGAIDQGEWMRHFIAQGLADFEAMLPAISADFCHGSAVTLADICLVPQVYNARRWQVNLDLFPKIASIDANLRAIPAFARAAPEAI